MHDKSKLPIFIHIPKAGGTTIRSSIQRYKPIDWHHPITFYSEEERNCRFTFAFTRNPFDRLLSAYKYLRGGGSHKGDAEIGKTLSNNFNSFVLKDLNDIICRLHFRPQMHYIEDINLFNFIGKFENLQEDFNTVCDNISISHIKLPHLNKSKHKHYTEYYTDETKQIVAEKYAKDIEQFGYDFGK